MQPPSVPSPVPPDAKIYSVSQLNREARRALQTALPPIWVEGEISNFHRHSSGHMYFSLKDEHAQVRCAMFRGANRRLQFQPGDGLQVLVHGRADIYEVRGAFQVIIEHMEPAGEGLLRRKLEELKTRLAGEGLFAAEAKQALPALPRRIGVITSPTGAAIRDIIQILRRRFAAVPVIIYPVQVQGATAKFEIVKALEVAAERQECDVLILARGGGSLEDLWAFNEEIVARAIFACPLPTISAVGHEVDVTISDLVADTRAPTPSGAAELAVPASATWLASLVAQQQRATRAIQRIVQHHAVAVGHLTARLERCHPGFIVAQRAQRLDELTQRLARTIRQSLIVQRIHVARLTAALRATAPVYRVHGEQQRLARACLRLAGAARARIARARERLAVSMAALNGVSPLRTLERGYAIVQDEATGQVLRDGGELTAGQDITGRLARGGFTAVVKKPLPR